MCKDEHKNSNESFLNGAVFGALVGAALGLLLAPDKGTETRKKLKSVYDEVEGKSKVLVDDALGAAKDLQIAARPLVDEGEARLAPIIDRIKEEGPEVKGEVVEKIAQLVSMMEKKADDLKGQKSFKDLKRKLFKNS